MMSMLGSALTGGTTCAALLGSIACHVDRRPDRPGDGLVAKASSATLDGASPSALAKATPRRLASRDTDSTGAGIVDGDLRPGTRAANPDVRDALKTDSVRLPPSSTGVPLTTGLRLTSALHFPDGDRENLVTVSSVSSEGVVFLWRLRQQNRDGKVVTLAVRRLVSLNDLASAPRLNWVYGTSERSETPGYTAMSMSRASFARISRESQIPYTITEFEVGPLGDRFDAMTGGLTSARLAYRGTLTRVSATPEAMPVLLDGVRTRLPTVHVRGHFALQDKSIAAEFWFLADSANPLLMRSIVGEDVLQMIRIDRPNGAGVSGVEGALARDCRAELPGIYFAFASADLEPESHSALAVVAALLARHPDWTMAIEGHTDSIGGAAANQTLSEQRAQAVRSALVVDFHVNAGRLQSRGFGASRPKESNTTIEGRARNRRVEVVRPCGGG